MNMQKIPNFTPGRANDHLPINDTIIQRNRDYKNENTDQTPPALTNITSITNLINEENSKLHYLIQQLNNINHHLLNNNKDPEPPTANPANNNNPTGALQKLINATNDYHNLNNALNIAIDTLESTL